MRGNQERKEREGEALDGEKRIRDREAKHWRRSSVYITKDTAVTVTHVLKAWSPDCGVTWQRSILSEVGLNERKLGYWNVSVKGITPSSPPLPLPCLLLHAFHRVSSSSLHPFLPWCYTMLLRAHSKKTQRPHLELSSNKPSPFAQLSWELCHSSKNPTCRNLQKVTKKKQR